VFEKRGEKRYLGKKMIGEEDPKVVEDLDYKSVIIRAGRLPNATV
jgi:hypothetical protein